MMCHVRLTASRFNDQSRYLLTIANNLAREVFVQFLLLIITLRASEAAAKCIVIGPVCGCVFVGLLPR